MPFEDDIAGALDQTQPIVPQVYRALRAAIVHNVLSPGNRISESEIAAAYGISRQPVREAFIRLAAEGLVTIRPQRGTIVTRIDYATVLDARFLREAIEADIVRLLAERPDPALVDELRALIRRQEEAADKNTFIRLDDAFHRTLAEGAGKGSAWKLIEGLKSQMDRVRFQSLGKFPTDKLVEQHRRVVDEIAAGQGARAETAIRLHLREVLNDLPDIVAANPEFFNLPAGDLPRPVNAPIQGGDTQ